MHLELTVESTRVEQFINISPQINELLQRSQIQDGCCTVFVSHTTAAVTVNEDADPAVMEDILGFLQNMVPLKGNYRHSEGNSAAHIKASLLGCSLHLIIRNGYLELGT